MASTRPIFVVGCPRSGTTMLSLMLHAHSRIAMPPETRFVQRVYRDQRLFGDLTVPANRARVAEFIVNGHDTKFRDLRLDADVVRRAIVDAPPTIGSAIGTVFRAYAARFGKERWGDKRPLYYQSIDAIRAMFPEAQFVHLIRDCRDCVASLLHMPWFGGTMNGAVALWSESIDCGRRAARRLPPGTYYELQYEHLVADPRRELEKLCAFLGEDFEESMLEPHKVAEQTVPGRKRWHAKTRQEVTASHIGSYAGVLTPKEVRHINTVVRRKLRRLGYDIPDRQGLPPLDLLVRYAVRSTRRRIRVHRLKRRDRRIARSGPPMDDRGPVPPS